MPEPSLTMRYPTDLTDDEWKRVELLISQGVFRRKANTREVLNAIRYFLSTGCGWNHLPKEMPPKSTVYDQYHRWEANGTLSRIMSAISAKTLPLFKG
jgi:transposase